MLHQNLPGQTTGGSALYSKSVCEDPQKVSGPYIQAGEGWKGLHMGRIYFENINGK